LRLENWKIGSIDEVEMVDNRIAKRRSVVGAPSPGTDLPDY
jgi:hypothetical protein